MQYSEPENRQSTKEDTMLQQVPNRKPQPEQTGSSCSLVFLASASILIGLATGAICGVFRLFLKGLETARTDLALRFLHGSPWEGCFLVVGVALAALVAVEMVRRFAPLASGSGIPHVEAVLSGVAVPAPWVLIPVKFIGGLLAIGSGLALGREGPSVQMGAAAANTIGRLLSLGQADCRALLAAGAGAGLATAFNAPAAGAVFVLEELVGRFEARMVCAALGASISAILISRGILGGQPDFIVFHQVPPEAIAKQLFFVMTGLMTGLLAVGYNRTILAALRLADRLPVSIPVRAVLIGGLAGLVVWLDPHLAGGGDWITQAAINNTISWRIIPALFVFRLIFGAISYAAATPGGLFAPMLALGALSGLACSFVAQILSPDTALATTPFVIVGMASMFAGSVRSPLTGIILVMEMTGSSDLVLPLLSGSFAAMVVAGALGDTPIYEALRLRAATGRR
ncbi:ClC family H(+)/Cl(-) exchange transporter [Komagataeibacter xylinus]|uniref:ClC family H(+)/Cl(-) exchange transporter n=2 Tax=Acetobacteraceae TaxID=433 RepID=A0A318PXZ9_KOMXY|nr:MULTISPECIES: ClC family H(+)/Cl(-) exchange transporter [Komagataeibacter]PYD55507.1 ClC family H(+)/Cl(-) exchange transporter [Komagataeibacter xylinus]QHC37610.1 ClC family H(+)/Cl(-) exchange transporter [Komagataeibacter xylinus]